MNTELIHNLNWEEADCVFYTDTSEGRFAVHKSDDGLVLLTLNEKDIYRTYDGDVKKTMLVAENNYLRKRLRIEGSMIAENNLLRKLLNSQK